MIKASVCDICDSFYLQGSVQIAIPAAPIPRLGDDMAYHSSGVYTMWVSSSSLRIFTACTLWLDDGASLQLRKGKANCFS